MLDWVDLVIQIGEMLTYQAYNIKSPLSGEAGNCGPTLRGKVRSIHKIFIWVGAKQNANAMRRMAYYDLTIAPND